LLPFLKYLRELESTSGSPNMEHDKFTLTQREAHLSKRRNQAVQSYQPQYYTKQKRKPDTVLKLVTEDYYQERQRKKVELIPKSLNQETYIDLLTDTSKLIIFATGPAGTGKTMLAVMAAIQAYQRGDCKKIVITRPAVGVDDEQHGFLPGDINAKMAPWTRPILDVFADYYRQTEITRMLDESTIEVSPLAYMRGRTFKNSWIIADEMQNATPSQMKMLLTRLGDNSKMVVTGDTQQADRRESENGLIDFKRLTAEYENLRYVAGVEFAGRDIHRHAAVVEILKIYGEV
jgi:phosphate starvation-inducible PhoH-like protein